MIPQARSHAWHMARKWNRSKTDQNKANLPSTTPSVILRSDPLEIRRGTRCLFSKTHSTMPLRQRTAWVPRSSRLGVCGESPVFAQMCTSAHVGVPRPRLRRLWKVRRVCAGGNSRIFAVMVGWYAALRHKDGNCLFACGWGAIIAYIWYKVARLFMLVSNVFIRI